MERIMNDDPDEIMKLLESEAEFPKYLHVLIDNGFDNMKRAKSMNKYDSNESQNQDIKKVFLALY